MGKSYMAELRKKHRRKALAKRFGIVISFMLTACITAPTLTPSAVPPTATPVALPSETGVPPTAKATIAATTKATSAEPGQTKPAPTEARAQVAEAGAPFPEAPLCPDSGEAHDNSKFHTLWDAERGCHYDHEHGTNPFTPEVAEAFPGFDLHALLGGVEIGHTNPSSPMENTHKHGGFKWNVQLEHPEGCLGFDSATNGVNGSVIEYHGFGDYGIELETRFHSTAALLRLCNAADPTDFGYLYIVQLQDYGQRVTPYQGSVLPYPDSPLPAFDGSLAPYISVDCIGDVAQCRPGRSFILERGARAASTWISKGQQRVNPSGSTLFDLLWRVRDTYRVVDWNTLTYPVSYIWLCSSDDGQTYDPRGCNYNNTTTQVQEIAGEIPPDWDNLDGFDTDPRVGRVTAEGFTDKFGALAPDCTAPGEGCHPIKMVNAFVGTYGSVLVFTEGKGRNLISINPERDIYFCGERVCAEADAGAAPSGWVGPTN
jgi:hypothetical protein